MWQTCQWLHLKHNENIDEIKAEHTYMPSIWLSLAKLYQNSQFQKNEQKMQQTKKHPTNYPKIQQTKKILCKHDSL